eukprot:gnl/TRDRNA2_/TRDRNA2_79350_c0_seq2.p1 gnl/TRDRNA2_/TRDRNA2_79350_c0~~gnl/TRDRNA2_/TRDRNA2_79350_c0_seq2.p1  ORF type:complete len:339 (-),score=52.69 gnl/TRDRNA2_/TRDRNA2_79350_c0_seq2:547-1563(-)
MRKSILPNLGVAFNFAIPLPLLKLFKLKPTQDFVSCSPNTCMSKARVQTSHSYTGRMCATSRYLESQRGDSLFVDPLAERLAGDQAINDPMGSWILVPRTRYGDDLVLRAYNQSLSPCRQLVLLGAGMDTRAYRLRNVPELRVFEVDQQTTFDVKEPLLQGEKLSVMSRAVVGTDFSDASSNAVNPQWSRDLQVRGFDPNVPTVWLLEGLMMYLSISDQKALIEVVGRLSAPGSVVFHDAISKTYERQRISVAGAPFIGGSDEYIELWAELGGFDPKLSSLRSIDDVWVDRQNRTLELRPADNKGLKQWCRGRNVVLFVEVQKSKKIGASTDGLPVLR